MILIRKCALILLSYLFLSPALAESAQTALIIIDMQQYFIDRHGDRTETENKDKLKQLVAKQIYMINLAKAAGRPIVLVEYDCFDCRRTIPALTEAVKGYENLKVVKKETDNLFDDGNKYKSEIIGFLKSKNVKDLIIAGANGGACVLQSIGGAFQNNYNVIVAADSVADFNYQTFKYPYSFIDTSMDFNRKRLCPLCSFQEVVTADDLYNQPAQQQLSNSELKVPIMRKSNYSNSRMRSAQ